MKSILRLRAAALAVLAFAHPAGADEVEEALQMALEAYQAGDLKGAKEEVDFAAQLLAQMKAAGLSDFLPQPLDGWTRTDEETEGASAAMFGGGSMAKATYSRDGATVDIQMMADNQMVTAMGAMFGNAAMMGSMGKVKRIGRQKVVITPDGEMQAMIDGRILVQITGDAPVEEKEAYFEAIDFDGLKDF